MERRPYLDKISNNAHIPAAEGCTNLNSTTVFPDLRHTGLRSIFEPASVIVATPEGRITTDFKKESYMTLKDIYHDDIELKNREVMFKKSHKQFIDDILMDLETKKSQSLEKRSKFWSSNKSKLGFSDHFNSKYDDKDHLATMSTGQRSHSPPKTVSSFADKEERKQKPVNRMLLFKALLETTDAPKSPNPRFGTISSHK